MSSEDAQRRRRTLDKALRAEQVVSDLLVSKGFVVLDRNWRGGRGELDLVVARQGAVRFVEVKARDPRDPTGLDAVDHGKRRRLVSAAEAWLAGREAPVECAFMVALVRFDDWSVELIDDAFDGG